MEISNSENNAAVIFYFSGTGNSLFIADKLKEQFAKEGMETLVQEMESSRVSHCWAEIIGFVFPLYFYGIPSLVRHFIESLPQAEDRYIFALVTAIYPDGQALSQMNEILSKKKTQLSYGRYITMPGNYIITMKTDDEKSREKKIRKAVDLIPALAFDILGRKKLIQKERLWYQWITNSRSKYENWRTGLSKADNPFIAGEKCNGCSFCASACPVQNITMEKRRPVWNHNCQQCLRCLHFCPREAIEYGIQTAGKKRYSKFKELIMNV